MGNSCKKWTKSSKEENLEKMPPPVQVTEPNKYSVPDSNPSFEAQPVQPPPPAGSAEALFLKYSNGAEVLTPEESDGIVAFFNLLGFPLDQAEGFLAFYVLNANMKKCVETEVKKVYTSSRDLRKFFEYVFLTSKKVDTEFRNVSRDMALPILRSKDSAVLVKANRYFKNSPIAQKFYDYLESSSLQSFPKDDWCSMVLFT